MNVSISPGRKSAADRSRPWLISAIAATACVALAACGLQKGRYAGCPGGEVHGATPGTKTVAGNAAQECGHAAGRVRLASRVLSKDSAVPLCSPASTGAHQRERGADLGGRSP